MKFLKQENKENMGKKTKHMTNFEITKMAFFRKNVNLFELTAWISSLFYNNPLEFSFFFN